MNILTVYSCNYWHDDVQHEKATKVNEKKPMIRNVISSTYTQRKGGGMTMFASLLYTQRERPTKSQASSTSVAFSILPFRLIFSVDPLIFQTQVSPHIYPPRILLFSEVFAYTKSTRVDGEWKHFQHHVCSCFLLYSCAEMGDPVKRGSDTTRIHNICVSVCVGLQYTNTKGIAYTTREGVATPTASLAAYLQLFHSHDPIRHH